MAVLSIFYDCNSVRVAFLISSECAIVPVCSSVLPVRIANGDWACAIVMPNNSVSFGAPTFYPNAICNERKMDRLDLPPLNGPPIKSPPVEHWQHKTLSATSFNKKTIRTKWRESKFYTCPHHNRYKHQCEQISHPDKDYNSSPPIYCTAFQTMLRYLIYPPIDCNANIKRNKHTDTHSHRPLQRQPPVRTKRIPDGPICPHRSLWKCPPNSDIIHRWGLWRPLCTPRKTRAPLVTKSRSYRDWLSLKCRNMPRVRSHHSYHTPLFH